jgi:hypothetical protein
LTTTRLAVAVAFLGIFALATGVPVDSDMWWHLRAGAWMVDHHRILSTDPFSWTRFNQPWVDHSWLSEVGLYELWRAFAAPGVSVAVAILATTTYLFVYLQSPGTVYARALVVEFAALSTGLPWWPARPEILSLALVACFAYILAQFRWHGVNRLWLLPPLMAVWVNLHAGFILGLVLLGITVAGQLVSRATGQRGAGVVDRRGIGLLAMTGLACVAVVSLNPHGPSMLTYPFHVMSIGVLRNVIAEWRSPDFHQLWGQMYIVLLLGTFAAMAWSPKRVDLTDLLLTAAFAYAGLLAARNLVLFTVVAPPVLTRCLAAAAEDGRARSSAPTGDSRAAPRPQVVLNWLLLSLVVAVAVVNVAVTVRATVAETVLRRAMPVAAADYIRAAHPPGRMFNSYVWGGYLMWRLYPNYPVYVDGRTDLYGDAFVTEYLRLAGGSDDWRTAFRERDIRLVVIETGSSLAAALQRTAEWTLAYHDELASVFVRAGP